MEKLFKNHFWVFHALFLALTAYLGASAVNAGVGAMLKAKLEGGAVVVAQKGALDRGRTRNFERATDANIFNARRETVEELPEGMLACKEDADCEEGKCDNGACVAGDPTNDIASAVETELQVRLVGTAVFSDPTFSLASIVDEGGGRGAEAELHSINECPQSAISVGDAGPDLHGPSRAPCRDLLAEAEIRLIDAERVYIYNRSEERFEYLELGKEKAKGTKVAAVKKKKTTRRGKNKVADELAQHIKKTGDNTYDIEQEGVNKALGDLSSLATQARIVPAFEGGEAVGFKLFSIRPGSLYSKIGVQNGDVISRINGYEMNSPDKALEIYSKLKDAKEISIDLKRRGKPLSMQYNITP